MMSENKGILGNSQLMMVWKLRTMARVVWQAVAESAPTRRRASSCCPLANIVSKAAGLRVYCKEHHQIVIQEEKSLFLRV